MSVSYTWELPADSTAPGQGRWHVREMLADHLEAIDAELVATELITNAWRHGEGPITVTAELTDGFVYLRVCSRSLDIPQVDTDPDADESGGRGLLLISELTSEWGYERDGERLCVWAKVPATH